ncbi:MAG: SDR family oxidoreductase [Candidatus Helarchaeota archaeon]
MKDIKIFILGASGFIGYNIFKVLIENFDVYGTYYNNYELIKDNSKRFFKVNILNLLELQNLMEKINPDFVINCVAISSPFKAEQDKDLAYKVNVVGTENLTKICKKIRTRIIHFSTDNVFDGKKPQNEYYTEEDLPNPINYYGKTKLMSEKSVLNLQNGIILRTSLVYGNIMHGQHGNFIHDVIRKCRNNEQIFAYIDQYRTPTSVIDIARSIELIVRNTDSVPGGIYNISGPDALSRYDMAIEICNVFQLDRNLINKTTCDNVKMPQNLSLDSTKVLKIIKIKFKRFKNGIYEMYINGLKK